MHCTGMLQMDAKLLHGKGFTLKPCTDTDALRARLFWQEITCMSPYFSVDCRSVLLGADCDNYSQL